MYMYRPRNCCISIDLVIAATTVHNVTCTCSWTLRLSFHYGFKSYQVTHNLSGVLLCRRHDCNAWKVRGLVYLNEVVHTLVGWLQRDQPSYSECYQRIVSVTCHDVYASWSRCPIAILAWSYACASYRFHCTIMYRYILFLSLHLLVWYMYIV